MAPIPETSADLFRQADALYTQIYRLRKASFVPTHIGLGTWGRYEPTTTQQERIAQLTKARNKVYSKAKRLQQQGK